VKLAVVESSSRKGSKSSSSSSNSSRSTCSSSRSSTNSTRSITKLQMFRKEWETDWGAVQKKWNIFFNKYF